MCVYRTDRNCLPARTPYRQKDSYIRCSKNCMLIGAVFPSLWRIIKREFVPDEVFRSAALPRDTNEMAKQLNFSWARRFLPIETAKCPSLMKLHCIKDESRRKEWLKTFSLKIALSKTSGRFGQELKFNRSVGERSVMQQRTHETCTTLANKRTPLDKSPPPVTLVVHQRVYND